MDSISLGIDVLFAFPPEFSELPEEPYDSRSLYERLKEQKDKKDLEFEETHKLSMYFPNRIVWPHRNVVCVNNVLFHL